jgi:hypothetical protein
MPAPDPDWPKDGPGDCKNRARSLQTNIGRLVFRLNRLRSSAASNGRQFKNSVDSQEKQKTDHVEA